MQQRTLASIGHVSLRGEGIAQVGPTEVSVPGAFGGETVEIDLVHRSRQHPRAGGRLHRIVEPHPARRTAPCIRHEGRTGRCGGCPLMELAEPAQREQKRAMLSVLGIELAGELVHDPAREFDYRFSSKRVCFRRGTKVRLGSWARASHEGAWMEGCLVEHPLVRAAASELEREANALGIAPYEERSAQGDLRYAWFKTDSERVALTLITASEDSPAARELPGRLTLSHTIAWSVQSGTTNAIRGDAPRVLRGADEPLRVELAGVTIEVGPLGFLQPNPRLLERAYRDLVCDEHGVALEGELAWDLYAGAGVTGALLRERFARVELCESYPESAAALGIEPIEVEPFLGARTDARPGLVIANPPRRGLGPEVCAALIASGAARIHVMSCGPEGLVRDLARLEAAGYRRVALTGYDTLPQTPHVELVAKLVKGTG